MATAFLGYVLPWGKMSYWGATVITKFITVIPFIGNLILEGVWGGYAVRVYPTLSRFFALHFFLPFMIILLIFVHLFFLHLNGSGKPLGIKREGEKISFHPYFTLKDLFFFFYVFLVFILIIFIYPKIFMDRSNFVEANPLLTPIHIQPEWYFLPAYAILRSIPSKLGGVVALLFSIIVLFFIPYLITIHQNNFHYNIFYRIHFWIWVSKVICLMWIGSKRVENPYVFIGRVSTFIYFIFFFNLSFFPQLVKYIFF